MATPNNRKELYSRDFGVNVVEGSKPIKYGGFELPEYFYFTAYFWDSDGKKVTAKNSKEFKTWSVKFLIRVTPAESLEVITSTIKGGFDYKGHPVVSFGVIDEAKEFKNLKPIKPAYYKAVADNRARLLGYAATQAVQHFHYKKRKDGSHYWSLFEIRDLTEEALGVIAKRTQNNSYVRKDYAFYVEVARIYREAVKNGEWPNEVLKQKYPKEPAYSTKTVQGWTQRCRELKLLPSSDKAKTSTVRKTVSRGKKG